MQKGRRRRKDGMPRRAILSEREWRSGISTGAISEGFGQSLIMDVMLTKKSQLGRSEMFGYTSPLQHAGVTGREAPSESFQGRESLPVAERSLYGTST